MRLPRQLLVGDYHFSTSYCQMDRCEADDLKGSCRWGIWALNNGYDVRLELRVRYGLDEAFVRASDVQAAKLAEQAASVRGYARPSLEYWKFVSQAGRLRKRLAGLALARKTFFFYLNALVLGRLPREPPVEEVRKWGVLAAVVLGCRALANFFGCDQSRSQAQAQPHSQLRPPRQP